MRRRTGFTLIEMLIVIMIILILLTMTVALFNTWFRGQGVRRGAITLSQALAQTKMRAAELHKHHFLIFSQVNRAQLDPLATLWTDQWFEIHQDMNLDGIYQGDFDPRTDGDADPAIDGHEIRLSKFVYCDFAPQWIGVSPSGYMWFSGGFNEVQASSFDAVMNGPNPNAIGDVIIRVKGRAYAMCVDFDRAIGKVRRQFFLNEDPGTGTP